MCSGNVHSARTNIYRMIALQEADTAQSNLAMRISREERLFLKILEKSVFIKRLIKMKIQDNYGGST
jgi:hypothetical protein